MPRIEYEIGLGLVGCNRSGEFEIPDTDWEYMTELEREREVEAYIQDELSNVLDIAWSVAE